jgi:hypothetical protein
MRLGYVPLAELGAEFLFQVIADRAEQAAVLLTTNLPFSEWTQVIPNARLCKALLDRITDRAHIIETGSDSYRFRRTLELRGRHVRFEDNEHSYPRISTIHRERFSPWNPRSKELATTTAIPLHCHHPLPPASARRLKSGSSN